MRLMDVHAKRLKSASPGRSRLRGALIAVVLAGLSPGPASAQDMRTVQVHFAPGTTGTTLSDRIRGREYVLYKVGAEAGQRMKVRLSSRNTSTYFNVYAPGRGPGDEALAVSEQTGPMIPALNAFDGVLPNSGVYSVSVYLYRNAARRGDTSNYRLEISITGDTGSIVKGDYADGLQGGPDFWRVQAGGGLNLRSAPSGGASVRLKLPNGLDVRNLGCRMAEGRRWCKVSTPEPSATGWVAGAFLVEGSDETATQLRGRVPASKPSGNMDRPVGGVLPEGSAFTATGLTECAFSQGAAGKTCEFGVVREGNGNGTVMIFWPETGTRSIYFQAGRPVSYDQSQADACKKMRVTREADMSIISIGEERYVIPDAAIYGG